MWLPTAAYCCYPVAVPDKIFGLTLFLDFIDRCHSLPSLHLPQAALGSLPKFSLASPVQIEQKTKNNQHRMVLVIFWSC